MPRLSSPDVGARERNSQVTTEREKGNETPQRPSDYRTRVGNVVTGEVHDGLYTFQLDGKPVDLPILIVDGRAQDLGMWAIVREEE